MHGRNVVVGSIFALVCTAILWWWLGVSTQTRQHTAAEATPAHVGSASSNAPSDDARSVQPHRPDQPARPTPTGNAEAVSTAKPAATRPARSVADNTSPIDPSRAADLFAERLVKLEDIDAIDNGSDLLAAREYRKFKSQPTDDAHAREITPALRRYVEDWVAQLPLEQQSQIALVNVECRASLCQILLAQQATNLNADAIQARKAAATGLQQLLFASPQEPSWSQLHLAFVSSQVLRQNDYLFYTFYLETRDGF